MSTAEREPFPQTARWAVQDAQLRRNLGRATATIRARRAAVVAELPEWEALRAAGAAIKDELLARLDHYLIQLEERVTARGGVVHWARDGAEARALVTRLAVEAGAQEVVKVKSLTTEEIQLNPALEAAGLTVVETDLAELICQLAGEPSSHILVPAIHKNRSEIRDLFARRLPDLRDGATTLSDRPEDLTAAARAYLRQRFLRAEVAVSGANFAVAETGTVVVVESEGNGRMCLTLPRVLITVMGVEKLLPRWADLGVFLQLLPRSATGERMNPYTSLWSGLTPGDGPQAFHLVLLDGGRTPLLADRETRPTLRCIRCSACLNVCPVYERTGGHAYRSVYPGPIGAILTPQLRGIERAASLPFASTLCGACAEVCPVGIDIPRILVRLRSDVVAQQRRRRPAALDPGRMMQALAWAFADPGRFERAQRWLRRSARPLARGGTIRRLPVGLGGWTDTRDLPVPPPQTFREWWRQERLRP